MPFLAFKGFDQAGKEPKTPEVAYRGLPFILLLYSRSEEFFEFQVVLMSLRLQLAVLLLAYVSLLLGLQSEPPLKESGKLLFGMRGERTSKQQKG